MYRIKIDRNEVLPWTSCIFINIYYTLKGWKYSSAFIETFLVIGFICGFLYLFKFIGSRVKGIMLMLPFVLLIVYRMYLGGDTRLVVSLLAIFVGMKMDFEKIVSCLFYSKVSALIWVLLLGGYTHLNYCAMNLGTLIFLMLLIFYKKNKKRALVVALLLYVFGVFYTKSGSMIVCTGIGILMYLLLDTKFEQKIFQCKILSFLFPAVLLLNWVSACLYAAYGYADSNYFFIKSLVPSFAESKMLLYINAFNHFLSGRINLAAFSLEKFGVSLWGGNIDYNIDTGLPYFLVDSGMMLLLQDWGIVLMVTIMILFVFLMWKLVKNRQYQYIISAIVIALWAFNEDTLLAIGTNYLFYLIGYELYSYKNKKSIKYYHS